MNISPIVVDFNLQHFFENDAYDIWKKGYFHKAGRLPHMKMIEYSDNIPIMGDGDPQWVYHNDKWVFELGESNHSQSIYCINSGRTAIPDWFEYSPEVLVSHMYHKNMKNIVNNIIPASTTFYDVNKYFLYKDLWPAIVPRLKRVGFEKFNLQPKSISADLDFMIEFQKMINLTDPHHTVKYFTKDEFVDLII